MRPFSLAVLAAAALGVSAAGAAAPAKEDISPLDEYEPCGSGLIKVVDGGTLDFPPEWLHAGSTSAVVIWRTPRRATSRIEYGPTQACEHKTSTTRPGRVLGLPFFTQFHRITGLEPGKTYHYRLVSIGTDGNEDKGTVRTFSTKPYEKAVRVPDDVKGPPYVLNQDGAVYVVTRDLVAPLAGFEITASDVTLDFDGHTLTYNNEPYEGPKEWSERAYKRNDFGVKCSGKGRVTIRNGCIVQGKGSSAGTQVGIGCNPVYSRGAPVTMEGMELIWHGADISGAFFHWAGDNQVHYCVFDDRGTVVTNRHQAISTIDGNGWTDCHWNLVRRTRQQGLMNVVQAEENEIYIDSCATNSFGIRPSNRAGKRVQVAVNRIFGIGEHPVGIAMFGVYPQCASVAGNQVEVKCTRSGTEYGYTGSACFRTTWGADNLHVECNTFTAYADMYDAKVAKARCVWVGLPHFTPKGGTKEIRNAQGVFANNIIRTIGRNGAKAGGICVVCLNESPNLIFVRNSVFSTWANVLLGDEYGHAGGYAKFVDNTFRREGADPNYRTILQQRTAIPGTGVFLGNSYEDGASPQNIELKEKGEVVFQTLLRLTVKDAGGEPLGDARVVVSDPGGKHALLDTTPHAETWAMLVADGDRLAAQRPVDETHRGLIEHIHLAEGELAVALVREIVTKDGRKAAGPYTVSAKKDGYQAAARTVDLTKTDHVEITLQR